MIIKFKKKIIPAIGDRRVKKCFVLFYLLEEGVVLFQNIYKKQTRCIGNYEYDSYNRERDKAMKGLMYDKYYIRKGWWRTDKVYIDKNDAFIEEL